MTVPYPRTLAVSLAMMAAAALFSAVWYRVEADRAASKASRLIEDEETFHRRALDRAAADLSARLSALLATESARPFYHYQNLYHDPRGAYQGGVSIIPSPLAEGTGNDWIRAHFQVDAAAHLTLPTLNEEAPSANQAVDLTVQRKIRDTLVPLAGPLRKAAEDAPLPAAGMTTQFVPYPREAPVQTAQGGKDPEEGVLRPSSSGSYGKTQRQQMDLEAWEQNSMANSLYRQLKEPGKEPESPIRGKGGKGNEQGSGTVQIDTEPFAWSRVIAAEHGTLAALRRVVTPDGILVQGFQVAPDALDRFSGETRHRWHPEQPQEQVEGVFFAPLREVPGGISRDVGTRIAAVRREGEAITSRVPWLWLRAISLAFVLVVFVTSMVWGAEALASRRSRFAAAAAHELRTPLAGLRMYSEMLAEGLGDPAKARDYARRLSDESARLGRVVANILGFTRIERGNFQIQPSSGDLAEAVRAAAEACRPSLEALGASLKTELPDGPLPARFDRDAVTQILQNLLDNAEKYGRGSADRAVVVRLERSEGKAILSVSDRGPGIPPDVRRRLFTPFRRGADPDAPAGLGLGLAITRTLARAQGGDVTHADNSGGGSVFTLTIPLPA